MRGSALLNDDIEEDAEEVAKGAGKDKEVPDRMVKGHHPPDIENCPECVGCASRPI